KHVEIKHFFAIEKISSDEKNLQYLPCCRRQADILTKPFKGLHYLILLDLLFCLDLKKYSSVPF
ncbi:MAG: hypothetical protein AAF840_14095, partial [Bacteroidota bacterium]